MNAAVVLVLLFIKVDWNKRASFIESLTTSAPSTKRHHCLLVGIQKLTKRDEIIESEHGIENSNTPQARVNNRGKVFWS